MGVLEFRATWQVRGFRASLLGLRALVIGLRV